QRGARSLCPASPHCCFTLRRNLPVRFEAAKVVDPQQIEVARLGRNTLSPPGEIIGGHALPFVMWIAPALAGLGKIIGWDTRDREHLTLGIELEQLRMRPYVGAVVRDENRNIAKQGNTEAPRFRLQRHPLLGEHELLELDVGDALPAPVALRCESGLGAIAKGDFPVAPNA